MTTNSSSSRQALHLDEDPPMSPKKKKKALTLTVPTLLFMGLLFIAIVIAVGLIVYFAAPREKCDIQLQRRLSCERYIEANGRDKVCAEYDRRMQPETKKETPKEAATEDKADKTVDEKVTGLRLNRSVVPWHYDLELFPHIYEGDDFGLDGNVTIYIKSNDVNDVIVLHINMLTVHNESVVLRDTKGDLINVTRIEEDTERHFIKFYPQNGLQKDQNYTLFMTFNGTTIHKDLLGFYRSSYKENNKTHWIVSTQFEVPGARRAFPCFDEPFFKATFNVTMVRRNDFISIGNMELRTTEDRGGNWKADVYEKSVVMTTYLVAFVVCQYDYVERRTPSGTRLRIYSRPSYLKHAEYSLNITGPLLESFEAWTGIPYGLPKLDQVTIPSFTFGAMENWGIVKYREEALLYNPKHTEIGVKQYIGGIVAHELAHMWFGNLVTCDWWDDTFLNEAFATYFGDHVGIAEVEKTWKMWEFFSRRVHYIMELDGHYSSQPVYVPDAEHHDDIFKVFNRITYYKGGAILRMLRNFLSPDTFQKAIRVYLNRKAYSTAVHEDLYLALQEQAENDGTVTWDSAKTNISGILDTWIEQMNYPLVHVTDLRNGKLKVTQKRFIYEKDKKVKYPTPIGSEFIWDIPLTYADKGQLMRNESKLQWMHREKEIELDGVDPQSLKLVNLRQIGFYRVQYAPESWNAIIQQLEEDHTVIPVENRAALLDDAFQIAILGDMSELDALRATRYLRKETEYLPWYTGLRTRLLHYYNMFYGTPTYDHLERYILNLVLPTYNRSGWTVSESDNHLDRYTRRHVLREACNRHYKPCVDKARELYQQYMDDPDNNRISPDIREVVYCVGVSTGGSREWDFLRSRYEHDYGDEFISYENSTVESTLSCPSDPSVIRKYLDYALFKNSSDLFKAMADRRVAQDTVWNYITEHWDDFMDGNKTRIKRSTILTAVTKNMNTEGDLRKVKIFIEAHNESSLADTFTKVMDTIMENIEWMDTNQEVINDWLIKVNSNTLGPMSQASLGRRRRSVPREPQADPFNVYSIPT